MNQILSIIKPKKKLVNILKVQLFFSVLGIITVIVFSSITTKNNLSTENYSKMLLVNQKITSIYQMQKLEEESNIFCTIEIPKIGIVYPVFNTFSEELLKLAPCKFSGPALAESGNISIAGHNLENHTFFSDLNKLEINDVIYLYSNSNKKFEYNIYKIYEIVSSDLSPIQSNFINKKELTLVTCNNKNKKRFIVKALLND